EVDAEVGARAPAERLRDVDGGQALDPLIEGQQPRVLAPHDRAADLQVWQGIDAHAPEHRLVLVVVGSDAEKPKVRAGVVAGYESTVRPELLGWASPLAGRGHTRGVVERVGPPGLRARVAVDDPDVDLERSDRLVLAEARAEFQDRPDVAP